MESTEDVKSRVSTLEGRWKQTDARLEHLDGRVGSLAVDMASIKADVGTIVKGLDSLAVRASQPVNWIGVASLIVTMIVVGSQYVDLRLAPIGEDVAQNRQIVLDLRESLTRRGEWIAEYKARVQHLEDEKTTLFSHSHESEARIDALEAQSAAAIVSRRAMGDYLKEVDDSGTRFMLSREVK